MNVDVEHDKDLVLLCDIPYEQYERIIDVLQEFHTRHTYDRGRLEMWRVLYGLTWDTYQRLLDAMGDHPFRHTYDRGTLEMMTPRKDHEWVKKLLGRMLEAMSLAMDIPIQSVSSMTLTSAQADRGLQPDESYYIAHEAQMREKQLYSPDEDPPPDLVIEVDVTDTCLPRLPVYARIGIPEIWRHDGREMQFYGLGPEGEYARIERSEAFAFLTPETITRFVEMRHETDENSVVRAFVDWARTARDGNP